MRDEPSTAAILEIWSLCAASARRRDALRDLRRVPPDAADILRRERERENRGRGSRDRTRAPPHGRCTGSPSSPKTGTSIQLKSSLKPVHQITLAASTTRPSSSTGSPFSTRTVLGTRSTPAASRSFGLTRMSGAPLCEHMRPNLAADRRLDGEDARGDEPEDRQQRHAPCGSRCEPGCGPCPAREPRPVAAAHFHRDVGSRVAGADEENVALAQLGRLAVLAGVHLHDARIELGAKSGTVGLP